MPRVTNAPYTKARRKRVLRKTKGYFGNKSKLYKYAKDALARSGQYAYKHRKAQEGRLPQPVDHPHQCGGARMRPDVQPIYGRRQGRQHRP